MSAEGAMYIWRGPWVFAVQADERTLLDVGPAPIVASWKATGEDCTTSYPHMRLSDGVRVRRFRLVARFQ